MLLLLKCRVQVLDPEDHQWQPLKCRMLFIQRDGRVGTLCCCYCLLYLWACLSWSKISFSHFHDNFTRWEVIYTYETHHSNTSTALKKKKNKFTLAVEARYLMKQDLHLGSWIAFYIVHMTSFHSILSFGMWNRITEFLHWSMQSRSLCQSCKYSFSGASWCLLSKRRIKPYKKLQNILLPWKER